MQSHNAANTKTPAKTPSQQPATPSQPTPLPADLLRHIGGGEGTRTPGSPKGGW